MAFDETTAGHGKNKVFKIDNAGGTLTDISDYIGEVNFPNEIEEAEAAGGGAYKAGQESGEITLNGSISTAAGGAYMVLRAIKGVEDKDFEFGPMGSTAGYPRKTGKCFVKKLDVKTDSKGVPSFTATIRVTGTITEDTYSA